MDSLSSEVLNDAGSTRDLIFSGLIIEVEGNICCGKSTLSKAMTDIMNLHMANSSEVFFETVNQTFLRAFYQDTKRFSFAFQMYMLSTRISQVEDAWRQAKSEGRMVMLDRGLMGDAVFSHVNHRLGNMDQNEIVIYQSVCRERMPRSGHVKVDILLYLDVDPAECHRRVSTERKNDAEDGIPLSYLQAVDDTYFHLIMDCMGGIAPEHSEYIDMYCGPPPLLCVMRWDTYGSPTDMLLEIERLLCKQRRVPSVKFCEEVPLATEQSVQIQTEAEVEEYYQLLIGEHGPYAFESMRTATINWVLDHSNSFRRLTFGFLAQSVDVIFFGRPEISSPKKS